MCSKYYTVPQTVIRVRKDMIPKMSFIRPLNNVPILEQYSLKKKTKNLITCIFPEGFVVFICCHTHRQTTTSLPLRKYLICYIAVAVLFPKSGTVIKYLSGFHTYTTDVINGDEVNITKACVYTMFTHFFFHPVMELNDLKCKKKKGSGYFRILNLSINSLTSVC